MKANTTSRSPIASADVGRSEIRHVDAHLQVGVAAAASAPRFRPEMRHERTERHDTVDHGGVLVVPFPGGMQQRRERRAIQMNAFVDRAAHDVRARGSRRPQILAAEPCGRNLKSDAERFDDHRGVDDVGGIHWHGRRQPVHQDHGSDVYHEAARDRIFRAEARRTDTRSLTVR